MDSMPGALWPLMLERTEHAQRLGAQQVVPTTLELVFDSGVDFVVRTMRSRQHSTWNESGPEPARAAPRANPFLPYERDLFVADASDTHIVLLNKYNVVEQHLLVVTREFEEQESLLTVADFAALARCLGEFPSLGFYNSGRCAGASQRHKHLQLVPTPLSHGSAAVPIASLLPKGSAGANCEVTVAERLPFEHAVSVLPSCLSDSVSRAALVLHELYLAMLDRLSLRVPHPAAGAREADPYNLLVTPEWMLVVPRSAECFETISVNALGFAGSLLVSTPAERERLVSRGPMAALLATAFPTAHRASATCPRPQRG